MYAKKEKKYPVDAPKQNSNREKQVILLMIWNGEKLWHYFAVKKLLPLLNGMKSKHYSDFYCLNYLRYFKTKNKLESHEKNFKDKNFYNIVMPFEHTKILELNQYQKSDKAPFIIYADLEYIIEDWWM